MKGWLVTPSMLRPTTSVTYARHAAASSLVGAAIGAAILGLAETYGLAYAPTYSVVFTFVILIVVLAFRPRGIMGRPA